MPNPAPSEHISTSNEIERDLAEREIIMCQPEWCVAIANWRKKKLKQAQYRYRMKPEVKERRKLYQSEYLKTWNVTNIEKKRHYSRNRALRGRLYLRKLKDVPCADCGKRFPYYIMEFDHKKAAKRHANGKRMAMTCLAARSINSIEKEIAKCDVVCANCHKVRTHLRGIGLANWRTQCLTMNKNKLNVNVSCPNRNG